MYCTCINFNNDDLIVRVWFKIYTYIFIYLFVSFSIEIWWMRFFFSRAPNNPVKVDRKCFCLEIIGQILSLPSCMGLELRNMIFNLSISYLNDLEFKSENWKNNFLFWFFVVFCKGLNFLKTSLHQMRLEKICFIFHYYIFQGFF